jgi:hypothetical protein
MATSAKATYSAVAVAGVFNYDFVIENTSSAQFDIYGILLGAQFDVPIPNNLNQLNNVVFISSPLGWTGSVGAAGTTHFIDWFTNFQGNAAASGYIMPGQTRHFVFQSSSAPPQSLPFGCCYYDNANAWGYPFNGTAELVPQQPHFQFPFTEAMVNQLIGSLADGPLWVLGPHGPVPVDPGPSAIWKGAKAAWAEIAEAARALMTLGEDAAKLESEKVAPHQKLVQKRAATRKRATTRKT